MTNVVAIVALLPLTLQRRAVPAPHRRSHNLHSGQTDLVGGQTAQRLWGGHGLPLFSSWCKGNLDRLTIVVVIVVELEFHVQTLLSLCQKETDVTDTLDPSISYLRKLSPQYINQVFESSRGTFEVDCRMALEIFTSDDVDPP